MFDSFQILNEDKREYTYNKPIQDMMMITKSRLDYIYTDQKITLYNLTKVIIENTQELLGIDHKISYVLLNITE